jgi:hypothetical protein
MSMIEEIARYLSDNGFGVFDLDGITENADIFLDNLPQTPVECLAITQYGGNGRALQIFGNIENLNLQITARGRDFIALRNKLDNIIDLLEQTRPTLDGHFYPLITAKQNPIKLSGREDGVYIYAAQFNVSRWTIAN